MEIGKLFIIVLLVVNIITNIIVMDQLNYLRRKIDEFIKKF